MAKTRLGLYGGARALYGSFAGKVEEVITEAKTRLGLYGGTRMPYGTFSTKTIAVIQAAKINGVQLSLIVAVSGVPIP